MGRDLKGETERKELMAQERTGLELTELACRINQAHQACEKAVRTSLTYALEAGRLLLEAKEQCKHGNWGAWLQENFKGSERTAQAYMRVAHEFPKLEAAKAQRIADLTYTEALSAMARGTRAVAALPAAEAQEAIEMAEASMYGGVFKVACTLGQKKRDESSFDVPKPLLPTNLLERKVRVLHIPDTPHMQIRIGPNMAGLNLKANVEGLKREAEFVEWQNEIDELESQAKELRKQAERLEREAREERNRLDEAVKIVLEARYGPAHSFVETIDFEVAPELKEEFKKLPSHQVAEALWNDGRAKVTERGYWGDILLEPYSSTVLEPSPHGWTRIGSPDNVE